MSDDTARELEPRLRAPRVFLASASETLGTATALSHALQRNGLMPELWNRAFQLSQTNIENLELAASRVTGAIFVMGTEDTQIVRDRTTTAARDNVLFELGLFLGKLGRAQCVVIRPDIEDWRWPTDLNSVAAIRLPVESFKPEWRTGLASTDPALQVRIDETAANLARHFVAAERQRWGRMRGNVGYFLRAIRDTYADRVRVLSNGNIPQFRLNLMTPSSDQSICIACVDYESHFHESEFDQRWDEDNGKCGQAWKHCVQALYGGPNLAIADAHLAPMPPDSPSEIRACQSVLSTPVIWREQRVGVLNFDSHSPAEHTHVHNDAIRECFLVAALRVGDLLHGTR